MTIHKSTFTVVFLFSAVYFTRMGASELTISTDAPCEFHQFNCDDGSCIPEDRVCDGTVHCSLGEDEDACGELLQHPQCSAREYRCEDRSACVQHVHLCDGQPDCEDASDESGCDADHLQCEESEFLCLDRSACIAGTDVCDGHIDCVDGSDEADDCEGGYRAPCEVRCAGPTGVWTCPGNHQHEKQCATLQCDIHSQCRFSASGAVGCVCKKGFKSSTQKGHTCIDVDECAFHEEERVCGHQCYNTPGSFLCFCDSGYRLAADSRTCVVAGPEPVLVYATRHQVVSVAMKSLEQSTLLDNLDGVRGLAVDYDGRRMFWTESQVPLQPAVYAADLDQPMATKQIVAAFGLRKPHGITFDPSQKNVYIADTDRPAILACHVRPKAAQSSTRTAAPTSSSIFDIFRVLSPTPSLPVEEFVCVTVFNASVVQSPTEMAIDHRNGVLYWIELGSRPRIKYGPADGLSTTSAGTRSNRASWRYPLSTVRTLVAWGLMKPSALSLDLPTRKLFWADEVLSRVEWIGLDGRGRRVMQGIATGHPSALLVFENQALFADGSSSAIMAADKFTGDKQTVFVKDVKDVQALTVYHASMDKSKDLSRCLAKACSDVCLGGPRKSSTCACPPTHTLQPRSGDCEETVTAPVLYAAYRDELISMRVDLYSPLAVTQIRTENMDNIFTLAHLPDSGDIIYSNFKLEASGKFRSGIYRLSNMAESVRTTQLVADVGTVDSLAVDEPNGLLYWVDRRKGVIELASLDGRLRSQLPSESLAGPYAIAVDASHRKLHVSVAGSEPAIKSCDQAGSGCAVLVSSRVVLPCALTVAGHSLFWTDMASGDVSAVNIHTKLVTHYAVSRTMPVSVAVVGDVLLWTEMEAQTIFYVSIKQGAQASSLQEPTEIKTDKRGLTTIVIAQPRRASAHTDDSLVSQCSVSNGGCDHFCIHGLDGVTCLCSDGFLLTNDNSTCQREDEVVCQGYMCEDSSGCVTAEQVCDLALDCEDGSDEVNCTVPEKSCDQAEFTCTSSGHCIPLQFLCDHDDDCDDGSDETHNSCEVFNRTCSENQWLCADGTACVLSSVRCDGFDDCEDGSDEAPCSGGPEEKSLREACEARGRFYCEWVSQCIPGHWRCDGDPDCSSLEDEEGCSLAVTCLPWQHQCADGLCVSDEEQCVDLPAYSTQHTTDSISTNTASTAPTTTCSSDEFMCDDSQCIKSFLVCDTYFDCSDESDELDCEKTPDQNTSTGVTCEGKFACLSGECVDKSLVCDDTPHCRDGTDEQNCKLTCATFKGCHHKCEQTPRGPVCVCFHGYQLIDSHMCEDIDECSERNGGCGQRCENTPGSFLCSCVQGFALESDGKGCKATGARPQLFLSTGTGIFKFNSDEGSAAELVVSATDSVSGGLDINTRTGDMYWTTTIKQPQPASAVQSSALYRTSLGAHQGRDLAPPRTESDRVLVLSVEGRIRDIAVDWITGHLYFIVEEVLGPEQFLKIKVFTSEGHVTTLANEKRPAEVITLHGLALHPGKSLLFYLESSDIVSRWMDGRSRKSIISGLRSPLALSLDYPTERLFWLEAGDHDSSVVSVCHLDGSKRYQVTETSGPAANYLDVFEGLAYLTSPSADCIQRISTYDIDKAADSGLGGQSGSSLLDSSPTRFSRRRAANGGRKRGRSRKMQERRQKIGQSYNSRQRQTGCGRERVFREVQRPGPVRVVHALKQPIEENACANVSCMYVCVLSPEGGRCLCPDNYTLDTHNPFCYQNNERPSGSSQPTASTRTLNDDPSTTTVILETPGATTKVSIPGIPTTIALQTTSSVPSPDGTTATARASSGKAGQTSFSPVTQASASTVTVSLPPENTTNGHSKCKAGFTGPLCETPSERNTDHQRSGRKGQAHMVWIVAGVVIVAVLLGVATGIAVRWYLKRKRSRFSLLGTIAFKNPSFVGKRGDREELVPRVSFGDATFFREEEVDEEAISPGDQDWWRRLLERSRASVTVEPSSPLGKASPHRTISRVEEEVEDEEEEEEHEEDGEDTATTGPMMRGPVRRANDCATGRVSKGKGKDLQCLKTSEDKSRLLL